MGKVNNDFELIAKQYRKPIADYFNNSDFVAMIRCIEEFFGKINFEDLDLNVESIASIFALASSGSDSDSGGFDPFMAKLDSEINVLADSANSELSSKIVAISLGGTNNYASIGIVHSNGKILIDSLFNGFNPLDKEFDSANDFWDAALPRGFVDLISEIDLSDKIVAISIAHKVKNGYMQPGKFKCNELVIGDKRPSIAESYMSYLCYKGLVLPENFYEQIVVSPNDTVSVGLASVAAYKRQHPSDDVVFGAIILGTGTNTWIDGIVSEMGGFHAFAYSLLDMELALEDGKKVNFDRVVAGLKLATSFKEMIFALLGPDHSLSCKLNEISSCGQDDKICSLIFTLPYGDHVLADEMELSHKEKEFFTLIARKYLSRTINYLSKMIEALRKHSKKDQLLFVDGSLITKNPKFMYQLNDSLNGKGVQLCKQEFSFEAANHDVDLHGLEDNGTLAGTFMLGLSHKFLCE